MGNRIDPLFAGSAGWQHSPAGVGEYYQVIVEGLLVDKGDEYRSEAGRFVPFPLEAIGRPVPPGVLARRPQPGFAIHGRGAAFSTARRAGW